MPPPPAFRLVQVSDTHLSSQRAYFTDNFDVFVEAMSAEPPDLIVHSGDLSFDGPDHEDDLAFARAEQDRLAVPWKAIAGNHDIGEASGASKLDQFIDDERIARWRRLVGPNWWSHDTEFWRVIGLDTALMGSGHGEEDRQAAFLEDALRGRQGRPVLLFMHIPPFLEDPDDPRPNTSCLLPAPRRWLLDRCAGGGVAAIACGHLHVYQRQLWQGIEIVWAPSTGIVNNEKQHALGRNLPRAGYLEWRLERGHASHRLVEPPLFISYDVGAWNKEIGSTTEMPLRPLRR